MWGKNYIEFNVFSGGFFNTFFPQSDTQLVLQHQSEGWEIK